MAELSQLVARGRVVDLLVVDPLGDGGWGLLGRGCLPSCCVSCGGKTNVLLLDRVIIKVDIQNLKKKLNKRKREKKN